MHIIPVIDLLDGVVVHAKKGLRSKYQPITSKLTTSTKPLSIVKAFMDIYPFNTLYIADLTRIQNHNKQSNDIAIAKIIDNFPELTLWVDSGKNFNIQAINCAKNKYRAVLGSESFASIQGYQSSLQKISQPPILSLDFFSAGYQGPRSLLTRVEFWPQQVIAMTLKKVGANAGFDQAMLQMILNQSKQHDIYAAGGVRHLADIKLLGQLGAKGALIASALHQQQLSTGDIMAIASQ